MSKEFNKQFADEILQASTKKEIVTAIKKHDPKELTRNLGIRVRIVGEDAAVHWVQIFSDPPGIIIEPEKGSLIE
jgi:hypothetical protein